MKLIKNITLFAVLIFTSLFTKAQNALVIKVTDSKTGESLPGVVLRIIETNYFNFSNTDGIIVLPPLNSGNFTLHFKLLGYLPQEEKITIPMTNFDTIFVKLISIEEELDEIEVSSTRGNRTIKDEPTRVEFIAGEELEEKANMKPGDIRMLLAESTGIQTQQTSATSANSSIRIQGLDGRYTQILKDGFPLYSGFSGSLGLLQTPPLDLKQAEVIKGSTSTLFGGGAIAGMVNLISKTPDDGEDLKVFLNGTSAKGFDLNGFYAKKLIKTGFTVYAARNSNEAYDPSDIGLTAIPRFTRYTVNPRFYFYPNKKIKANIGISVTEEDRKGGNIDAINGKITLPEYYFENNKTKRYSSTFETVYKLSSKENIKLKSSYSYFKRTLTEMFYKFEGEQKNFFSEFSYSYNSGKHDWITGVNYLFEKFANPSNPVFSVMNLKYEINTFGVFIQNNYKLNKKISIESGLRNDYVLEYGNALLPRLSVLFKINPLLTSRVGAGLGYKTPTVFTESTERISFNSLMPVSTDRNKLEKSYGFNGDLNYRTYFEKSKISLNVNQLFFYTRINSPLLLHYVFEHLIPPYYILLNSAGHIDTRGAETNVKIGFGDFKLFLGYTFTYAELHTDSGHQLMFLTPKHRMNNVLMYEIEGKWKLGLEAYYFGKQKLSDGKMGKSYWICGFMVEKLWEKFSVFVNFENFLDVRQTKFDTIYTGTLSHPEFRDIYAPLDGFVVNGGIKYFPFGDKCCKK